jgi:branched-chain amino acid transport system ATP-binding protein
MARLLAPTRRRWRKSIAASRDCTSAAGITAPRLSGGEQQMLAMARVLVGEPNLLLVDEPSEGLAPMIVSEIYAILSELKQAGRAILLVEQNVAQALTVCERFVAMERGRLALEGDARAKPDREQLLSIMAV